MPHYAVRASLSMGRWSARACLPVRFSVLWPATWVAYSDKSRSSKSVEVRRIWDAYDESLSLVHPAFWEDIRSSLLAGDVSSVWSIWSFPAEVSLVRAFVGSGGPTPESRLGRGAAQFRCLPIGGPVVGRLRSDLGSGDVRLFIFLRILLFLGLSFFGVGLVVSYLFWMVSLGMALLCLVIWSLLLSGMLSSRLVLVVGPLCGANLAVSPAVGLSSFCDHVRVLCDVVVDFLHKVVVYRGDVVVRGWRSWVLEDGKVHPYRWLRPDLVAPAPFLCCDPGLTVDGSGLFLILIVLMSNFVLLGFPSFVVLVVVPLILLFSIGRLVVGSLA